MKPVIVPEWTWQQVEDRRSRWVQVFARLKPGYTAESAQAPMQGLFDQIREYELASLERLEVGAGAMAEGFSLAIPQVELNATMPLMPSNLITKWGSFREAKVAALRDAASKLRKIFEEASVIVQVGSPFTECEKIVQSAQNSLTDDLTRFFGNAELYRAGVFTHTTKDSIGALGLGKELDDLESEFGEMEPALILIPFG